MANFTQPQFALPFTLNGTVTMTFTTGANVGPVTIGSSSTTRWNDRTGATATDALAYLADAMNTADSGGTWAASEASGDYLGRSVLTTGRDAPAGDARTLATVIFAGGITGKMFGFTSNTATAGVALVGGTVTSTWCRQYLWIPQPASTILLGVNEKTSLDAVVATSSPDGTTTRDFYGGVNIRRVEIFSVPAASIWQHYADDADYAGKIGATTGDENCAFDEFRKLWRDGLPTSAYCKFWPDLATLPIYTQLEPGGDEMWMGDLSQALMVEQRAPYRYLLSLQAFDLGA